jgi:hypothetical protein
MHTQRVASLIVFLALLTVGCLASGVVAPTPSATAPTPAEIVSTSTVVVPPAPAGFKTPEEAITAYLEGVAQRDLQKILQACAIDEMSENFKFDLYTSRLGGVFLPTQFLAPADYPFYVETNKLQLSSQVTSRVRILAYSLLSDEKTGDGSPLTNMDAERTARFMKAVDPKRLAALEVRKIGRPDPTLMDSAKYRDNVAKTALSYGADESTERVVLLSFEQNYYSLGFTLFRYGENWKISSATSALANSNALGAAQPTTVEEFDSLTSK